jgi:guanylate kinase
MMMSDRRQGILFVIAAPSGAGKTTLAREVVKQLSDVEFSISYTTRKPRPGEENGRDYHFVDREHFELMVEDGAMLEWAKVFGKPYGTGLHETRRALAEGRDLLLEIDIQGASQVRRGAVASVSVMVLPPDHATLENRLIGRASEDETERARRLTEAMAEAREYENFDYVVVNDDLKQAVAAIAAIVRAERRRTSRCTAEADAILATFPA